MDHAGRATRMSTAFVLSTTAQIPAAAGRASSVCFMPPARRSSKCRAEHTSQPGLIVVESFVAGRAHVDVVVEW
jgi:hypothetical protein